MLQGQPFAIRLSAWLDDHLTFRGCLVVAGLLGLALSLDLLSFDFLLGRGVFWRSPPVDPAELLITLRYFDAEPWQWPLTHVAQLEAPTGISVANISLPLLLLLGKALQPVLGKDVNLFGAYELISMVLQPVAMLWLLWEMGVRNRVGLLCGALIALSFPIFLFRVGHIPAFGQYPITAALALYFALKERRGTALWVGFVGLSLLTMLINLYLTAMVDGILFAAVVADIVRSKRLRTAGTGTLLVLAVASLLILWLAEYLSIGGGTFQGNSYGYYSMNLLSPIAPQDSTLFGTAGQILDMTGGQYEGMAYLGAGLLLLALVVAAVLPIELRRDRSRRAIFAAARGNWPLLAVLSAFVAFAVTNEVFIGGYHLHVGLPVSSDLPGNFRSSGRFFWPPGYALAAGLIWLVDRAMPVGRASLVLLAVAALQFADAAYLRSSAAAFSRTSATATLPPEPWRRVVAAHAALTILPQFQCATEPAERRILDLLLYASEHPVPVNTMYTARSAEDCVAGAEAARNAVLDDGALHVFFDEEFSWGALRDLPGAEQLCRKFPSGHVCTGKWPILEQSGTLAGLNPPGSARYELGRSISFADPEAADFRGWGWWSAGGAGAWLMGSRADLVVDLAGSSPSAPLELRFHGHASLLGTTARHLEVSLGGVKLGDWTIADDSDHDYAVAVPAALAGSKNSLTFDFAMDMGNSPRDLHLRSDNRRLGFLMKDFSLAEAAR